MNKTDTAPIEASPAAAGARDRRLTLEEYGRLPYDKDAGKLELVRGQLVRERGPAPLHGRVASRVAYYLERYHEERRIRGAIMVNAAFVLAEDPATVRLPDIAYVAPEHVPAVRYSERWWRVAPDLAIEVTSPSNRWTGIQEKVRDYLEAGTRLVWVIDPPTRTVSVYGRESTASRLEGDAALTGEAVLPGLEISLRDLFDL